MCNASQCAAYKERELPVNPERLRVAREPDGQYAAHWGNHRAAIRVCRCFPWSDPGKYISLRDPEDKEIALVEHLGQLDEASRAAVEQALAETCFVFEIVQVDNIEEEFEIRNWSVITRQGPRTFQTKRDEWPRRVGSGGMLIRDVAGDLFFIADPRTLDPASRKRLRVYID